MTDGDVRGAVREVYGPTACGKAAGADSGSETTLGEDMLRNLVCAPSWLEASPRIGWQQGALIPAVQKDVAE